MEYVELIMRYHFGILTSILVVFLLSACVSYNPNKTPLLYDYFLIRGTSMEPVLQEPTIVLVKPVPYEEIQRGDIVVFSHRHQLVVHRAIEKKKGVWLTQGDGVQERDSIKVTNLNYRGTVYLDDNGYDTKEISDELFTGNLEQVQDK